MPSLAGPRTEEGAVSASRRVAGAAGDLAAEIRVLVTDLTVEDAARVAGRSGLFQVIVATGEDDEAPRYLPLGETGVVISPGLFGRYVVDVAVAMEGGRPVRVAPSLVRLDSAVPPSAMGKRILEAYQQRLKEERLVERTPRLPLPQGQQYLGAAACRACHAEQSAAWEGSRHAGAFASLQKDGRWSDPDCVPCHVTGFPLATGYSPEKDAPRLEGVGCECCHGPSNRHAADPKTRTPGKAREACAACHTPERSPKFEREAYLARIRHWK
jgi:hypothetical protein